MENKFPVCQENLEALRQIVFPLIKWYRENKRILPWRIRIMPIIPGCRKLCCSRPEWRQLSRIL